MDGNGLPFEIDTWNTNGTSLIWVKLPSMTNGTEFVMCWGATVSGKTVCGANPWNDYTGVWHLNETGGGVANVTDSTTNGLSGVTVASSSAVDSSDAIVGGARHVTTSDKNNPGINSGITIDLSDAAKQTAVNGLGTEFTASMWVRVTADFNYFYLVSRKSSDGYASWGVQTLNDTTGQVRFYSAGTTENQCASPQLSVALAAKNQWHKIDLCWKSDGTYVIYQDGANKLTGNLYGQTPAVQGDLNLSLGGALQNGTKKGGRGLNGDLDEVRLRAFVPSDDWAAADYATQANPAFLTAGIARPYGESPNPMVGIQVSPVGYTNATVTVSVTDFGTGASSADIVLEVSATGDFASPFLREIYSVGAADSRSFDVLGLSTNETYFVHAFATNNLDAAVEVGPYSFTTLAPGVPAASVSLATRGTDSIAVSGVATSFGAGSSFASIRLEVSTDDFVTTEFSDWRVALLDAPLILSVSNLVALTGYDVRIRLHNEWELETVVSLGRVYTLPPSGVKELYVDSLGSGSGLSPENALPKIREALEIAGADFTIWVRGGEGRAYGVTNNTDTLQIPPEMEGLSIRAYETMPGDGGRADVVISDTYVEDGNRFNIISNAATGVTISGLAFSFGTHSIGKQDVAGCSIFWSDGAFPTVENCVFRMPRPTGYAGSGTTPLVWCRTTDATNLVVRGCEFYNTRCWSVGHGYFPIKCMSNAQIVNNVFSNVNSVVTPEQHDWRRSGDIPSGNVLIASNIVYGANEHTVGEVSSGILRGTYPGPSSAEIAYNRFIFDRNARRENGSALPHCVWMSLGGAFASPLSGWDATLIHHNTFVGGEIAFLIKSTNSRKDRFYNNLIVLDAGGINIVENFSTNVTSFVSPSCFRANALLSDAFNGGAATEQEGYSLEAGLDIADNITLAAHPEFICTNDIYNADFYRVRCHPGDPNLKRLGWMGPDGLQPRFIGALEPVVPGSFTIHLR